MAWTVTLKSVERDLNNPTNLRATVRFVEGDKSFEKTVVGSDITVAGLKKWAYSVVASRAESDSAKSTLAAAVGQSITVTPPAAPDQDLLDFIERWNRLTKIKRLGTIANATLAATVSALQTQVETYLAADPTAIDKVA